MYPPSQTKIYLFLAAYFYSVTKKILMFGLPWSCICLYPTARCCICDMSCDLLTCIIWIYHPGASFWTSPPPVCWYYVTSRGNFTACWFLLTPVVWKSNYSLHHFRPQPGKTHVKTLHADVQTLLYVLQKFKMIAFVHIYPANIWYLGVVEYFPILLSDMNTEQD